VVDGLCLYLDFCPFLQFDGKNFADFLFSSEWLSFYFQCLGFAFVVVVVFYPRVLIRIFLHFLIYCWLVVTLLGIMRL